MTGLHETDDRARDDQIALLPVVLGLLSECAKIRETLAVPVKHGSMLAKDDPWVLAALGLIACERRLVRWLAAEPSAPAAPAPAPASNAGGLLR